MSREEMLQKLHSTKIGVELTALVSENALECEYVMSTGTKYEWIGLYDWPVYELNMPKGFNITLLKQALLDCTFCDSQIAATDVKKMYSEYVSSGHKDVPLSDFLSRLVDVSSFDGNVLYALNAGDEVLFFGTYEQLEVYFEKQHASAVTPWETYTDEELAHWLERIETEFKSIPLVSFDE
jgi:hypothetical protein